jgi:hypothetical protein
MKCEDNQEGKYISSDFKKILCKVHRRREDDHQEYIKLDDIDHHLDILLLQLEQIFIDFKICLGIVEMFLKEECTLKIDLVDLENFQLRLNREMEILIEIFREGTFSYRRFSTIAFGVGLLTPETHNI